MRSGRSRQGVGVARVLRAAALLLLCLPCTGCGFLMNEFTILDVAGPATQRTPDAPISGAQERP